MSDITEAQLYNLYQNRGPSDHTIATIAETIAVRLMVEHLYREHGMGVRDIARKMRLRQGVVSAIIADIKE